MCSLLRVTGCQKAMGKFEKAIDKVKKICYNPIIKGNNTKLMVIDN